MNKLVKSIALAALCAALVFVAVSAHAQNASAKPGDEFFVVVSLDRTQKGLILLSPQEIATVYQLTDKTQYFDENGKPIKVSDLHAGDTLFGSYMRKPDGTLVLEQVHKGDMTVSELRRRYFPGLPADAGKPAQSTPKPKPSTATSNNSSSIKSKSSNTKSNNPKSGKTKPNGTTAADPKSKQQTPHQ